MQIFKINRQKIHTVILSVLFLFELNSSIAQSGLTKIYQSISVDSIGQFLKNQYGKELVDPNGNINYIRPLKTLLANKFQYIEKGALKEYYYESGTLCTFIGDYRNAIAFFDSSENATRTKKITLSEDVLKRYDSLSVANLTKFYFAIDTSKIVMLNESHHKSLNRVFAYCLLDYLYQKGFRYLAAEALLNSSQAHLKNIPYPTRDLGFYTLDPMMAELFRHALELGFTLVPYDFIGDMVDREIMQAHTISKILIKNPSAKIFVYAGYGHIEKTVNDFKPMGYFLKMLTGLNPLSINQERYTEGNTNSITQEGYRYLVKKHKITHPGILMKGNQPFTPGNTQAHDLYIIHPITLKDELRADWLESFSLDKRKVQIQNINKECFLVQAYYQKEVKKAKEIDKLIPADQTYDSFPFYFLYLKRGFYLIVQRDLNNKIIVKKPLNIK